MLLPGSRLDLYWIVVSPTIKGLCPLYHLLILLAVMYYFLEVWHPPQTFLLFHCKSLYPINFVDLC